MKTSEYEQNDNNNNYMCSMNRLAMTKKLLFYDLNIDEK